MRIAFVTFSAVPFGSNDELFYRAAGELLKSGHSVLVSPYDWPSSLWPRQYDTIAEQGAKVVTHPRFARSPNIFIRQWDRLIHKFVDYQRYWRFLDDFRPDVVVVSDPATYHMLSSAGFAEFLLSRKTPYILISQYNDENTTIPGEQLPRAQQFFDRAARCVFVSQRNLDVARRQLCLALEQGCVIDNPPNLADWTPIAYPKAERATLAMVARLECSVKGQALVLQVLSGPRWKNRDWELNLYGKGPDEAYLRQLIHFLDLDDRVTMHGQIDDVRSVWRQNKLMIMASSGEGKPLALTEAMLCGRAAVVTDVGGNAELIEDGMTGFVAESPTLASIEEALERAWSQQTNWEQMGAVGHAVMIDRLSPKSEAVLAEWIAGTVQVAAGALSGNLL